MRGGGGGGNGRGERGVCLFSSGTRMLMLTYPGSNPYDGLYTGRLIPKGVPFKGLGI